MLNLAKTKLDCVFFHSNNNFLHVFDGCNCKLKLKSMSLKDYVKRGSFLAHSRYIIPHLATFLVCYTGGTLNGNQFFHCLVQFLQFPYSLAYTCVLIATIVSIPSNLPLFPRLGQPIVTLLTRIGPFVIVNIY